MRIIIAIDIIGGKCVRLTKGDYTTKKIYSSDPLEVARQVEDSGIRYLHLVDLDGASEKRIVNLRILEKIALKTSLHIDFGGGIRSEEDLNAAFDYGASQVTCGSVSVNQPLLFLEWLKKKGADKIILGADSKGRMVATEGWKESQEKDVVEFIKDYHSKGVLYTVCTDIEKDGMLEGPSLDLYREIKTKVKGINLIASGGITSLKDVEELSEAGCEGAIIGKAIYEGKLNLKELKKLC